MRGQRWSFQSRVTDKPIRGDGDRDTLTYISRDPEKRDRMKGPRCESEADLL